MNEHVLEYIAQIDTRDTTGRDLDDILSWMVREIHLQQVQINDTRWATSSD